MCLQYLFKSSSCIRYHSCYKMLKVSNKQVRFHALSTVVGVATKGCGNGNAWVTLYRLAYSADCVNFIDLMNSAGNNEVSNALLR